jgi:hypothetical protein
MATLPGTLDGYVVHLAGRSVTLRDGEVEVRAARATSCLVEPVLGDRVLYAVLRDGRAYVLAVLDREEEDAPLKLAADRDVIIEAQGGRLDLVAAGGIGVATPDKLTMAAEAVEMRADKGTFALDDVLFVGRRLLARAAKSTLVGEVLETMAETITQRAKRVLRVVSQVDQLKAGVADIEAKSALRMHAENSYITAEKVVKVDGENIHLG